MKTMEMSPNGVFYSLPLEEMETIEGGNAVDTACVVIGAGSVVYDLGVMTNWWNPIGWVSATLLVASAACVGYAASQL